MENQERVQVEAKPTWRLAWGLFWRTFLINLGVSGILGIIAAVVAFNIGGFLGQGTQQTAQTEMSSVQTAILAGMANASVGTVTAGTISPYDDTKTVYYPGGSFQLGYYLRLPTQGTWTWDSTGTVIRGTYSGGGMTCTYDYDAYSPWECT